MFRYNVNISREGACPFFTDAVKNALILERELARFKRSSDATLSLKTIESLDTTFHHWSLCTEDGYTKDDVHLNNVVVKYTHYSDSGSPLFIKDMPFSEAAFEIAKQLSELQQKEQFYLEAVAAVSACRAKAMAWDVNSGVGDGNFELLLCYLHLDAETMVRVGFNGNTNTFNFSTLRFDKGDLPASTKVLPELSNIVGDYMGVIKRIYELHDFTATDLVIS